MVGLKRRSSIFISAVFLFAVIYSDHPRGSGELRDIRLQGFLPMTGVGWPAGGACLPATLMAVRHVNGRAGLLDGYSVTYSWADSRVMLIIIIVILSCAAHYFLIFIY